MQTQHDHPQPGLDVAARKLLGTLPERWGRMGLMGRTALVEIGRVLHEKKMLTGASPSLLPGWSAGLIIGSKRGSLAVDIEYAQSLNAGPGMASPHLFSYTLPNIPLAEAAIQYGLTGPVFCMISDDPYNDALLEAEQWLTEMPGSKTLMVAGAMDINSSGETAEVTTKLKVLHTPMTHLTLVYPRWPKIPEQTEFHLPPHGPVCLAAEIPDNFEVTFVDENVDTLDLNRKTDVVLLSMMLTCQTPRGKEIAELYKSKGIKVIAGGIATMLHGEEIGQFVDSIFLGEVEDGRLAKVLNDWKNEQLQPTYNYFHDFPPIESIGPANRKILNDDLYTYRGVRMVDLVHASRGCKFNCFPCSTAFLGGRQFRPRPIDKVVEEVTAIDNNRLFFVDNSLAQDKEWLLELFEALIPLKKKWVSHPILDDDEVLAKAAEAGAWYVYQAIFDTSDVMRNRVRRLKEHGIGVEAAVLLGPDNQDVDYIKRLIDFLLEIDVDMAEFSILTPFPHTPVTKQFEEEGRILHRDWNRYTTAEVVYQPKNMTPDELQEMYHYAWDTFYKEMSQSLRMSRLFMKVVHSEIANNSYKSTLRLNEKRQWQS